MAFYKKTIPMHTSKEEKTSGESEPNNSEDVQTNPDNNSTSDNYNPNTAFRKRFSLLGNSILAGTKKVQSTAANFKYICGGLSVAKHPWLFDYYNNYSGAEYAIDHLGAENDRNVEIFFKEGGLGEYDRIEKKLVDRPFTWLSNTSYTNSPEKNEASTDDSKQAESDESNDIIVIYPKKTHNVRRIGIRSNGNKPGSDR